MAAALSVPLAVRAQLMVAEAYNDAVGETEAAVEVWASTEAAQVVLCARIEEPEAAILKLVGVRLRLGMQQSRR